VNLNCLTMGLCDYACAVYGWNDDGDDDAGYALTSHTWRVLRGLRGSSLRNCCVTVNGGWVLTLRSMLSCTIDGMRRVSEMILRWVMLAEWTWDFVGWANFWNCHYDQCCAFLGLLHRNVVN
jgi:hypothetical protein